MTILVPDYFDLRRTYSEKALEELMENVVQYNIENEYKKIYICYGFIIIVLVTSYTLFLNF
tara:strand:- start:2472 stop:2654 length:183 start_codon:yes stop_codon:yes gene_type:complete